MCRLLCVKSDKPFEVAGYLRQFADVARLSREYQGHGWGFAWWDTTRWQVYRNIKPIWEDCLARDISTTLLLTHARSAFEDRDIVVENNMPFREDQWAYIFNGELRGVRIKAEGRTGAAKIFNLIRSRHRKDMTIALTETMRMIEQRTTHLKAANVVLSDGESVWVASRFSEDPDYYTLRRKTYGDRIVICSEPFPGESDWSPIAQGLERIG